MKRSIVAAPLALIGLLTAGIAMAQDAPTKQDSAGAAAEIGKPAPDFELKGTDGKTYKLSGFKDKTVVLEWISRDCPTCRDQCEKMRASAEKLGKRGIIWLAIDSTGSRKVDDNIAYVKDKKLPYVILDDSAGKVGKTYGAKRTPTMFVVHKGKVEYIGSLIAQRGGDRNYVVDAAEALLDGKEPPLRETKPFG
ncbi:MAG: redoxin domain-containing protein [Phycisphaerae bacterium]